MKYLSAGASELFGGRLEWTAPDDVLLLDPAVPLELAGLRISLDLAPGHTPGSVCFTVEGTNLLFSGDTLFPGGPGNTKLPGADFATIIRSVEDRLFTLPADTLVLPGHGDSTTIGAERPHLQEWVDRGW